MTSISPRASVIHKYVELQKGEGYLTCHARSLGRNLIVLGAVASVLAAACADGDGPVEPTFSPNRPPPAPPFTPPAPAPPPAFPALARDGEIYRGADELYGVSQFHGGLLASRYVLYPDSVFALQFSSVRRGFFEYLGTYSRKDSHVTFEFSANAPSWRATAQLLGDSLTVTYNSMMQWDDFVGGVYRRSASMR